MSQFNYTKKPNWVGDGKDAYSAGNVVTDAKGWVYTPTSLRAGLMANPEVLVACRNLAAVNTDAAVAPTYTAAVSYSALAHMVTNDVLTVTLTASEAVEVLGAPKITVTINGTARQASYDQASSTSTSLVFKYTVVAGDIATAGQITVGTATVGGYISDILPSNKRAVSTVTFTAPNATAISAN